VHSGSFAPAFTLSFHDSECSRKPPMPIASVVMPHYKKKYMSTNKTFFTRIFGDEIGQMIQVTVGIFTFLGLFMLFPLIFIRLSTSKPKQEKYKEILADSKETTQNIFKNIVLYDSLTRDIDSKINSELLIEKDLINNKKNILIQCQKDFDSIYLTHSN
jgi:hypothetical protein